MADVALTLAGLALLILPPRPPVRARHVPAIPPWARGAMGMAAAGLLLDLPLWSVALLVVSVIAIARRCGRREDKPTPEALRRIAAVLDLIAACLAAGLPTGVAVTACLDQPGVPPRLAEALRRSGAMVALGGDGEAAARPLAGLPQLAPFAAGLRRTAYGGVRLAEVASDLAADLRSQCRSTEEASAARAGILMTAPLALCFLPAFLCLGLAPVVIGLVTSLDIW